MLIREFVDYQVMKTLYMCRPVENGQDIVDWALDQGFESAIATDDLHTTIAYSTTPIDWLSFMPMPGTITIKGGKREIHQFGRAIVLTIESEALHDRWQQIIDLGASWDHDEYRPHITFTYNLPEGVEIEDLTPFMDDIILGSERIEELRDNVEHKETTE